MIIDKDNWNRSADQWNFQTLFEIVDEVVCLREIVCDDQATLLYSYKVDKAAFRVKAILLCL